MRRNCERSRGAGEHDPEALAIFVTTREELAQAVIAEAKLRSRDNAVAREALERNGLVIVAAIG